MSKLNKLDPLTGKFWRCSAFYGVSENHCNDAKRAILDAIEKSKRNLYNAVKISSRNINLEEQPLPNARNLAIEMIIVSVIAQASKTIHDIFQANEGEPPPTLLIFICRLMRFWLWWIHVTVRKISGMYRGDRSRKETWWRYRFRLPSALDNHPLRFEEFDV